MPVSRTIGVSKVDLKSPAAFLFWLRANPASKFDLVCTFFGEGGGDKEVLPALMGGNDGCHRSIEPPFTGWVCGAMWVSGGSWSIRGVDVRSFNLCGLSSCVDWSAALVEERKLERESVRVLAE
jgi:hypothetical protein